MTQIIVDDQGIFDYGQWHIFELPCKHMIKIDQKTITDEAIREAVLEHMNSHVTILVRLGPGNPISKRLEP